MLNSLSRIGENVTELVQENPLVAIGVVAGGTALTTGALIGGVSAIRKRKARKRTTVRKKSKRKISRRVIHHVHTRKRKVRRPRIRVTRRRRKVKHISHRSPRHKGHKRVSFTTKTGQKVSFLSKR